MELNKVKLGDICEIYAGGDAPKNTTTYRTEENRIPVFSNGIENEGLYGFASAAKITKPSVTISARGTIGVPFLRKDPYVPIVRLLSAIPKEEKIDLYYLYYATKLLRYKKDGSVQQQLTVPMLADVTIQIPSLSEQKKIASVLTALDDKIALNKKMNQKLERMAKRLYDYWFVQYDFPDKNGLPYKTTGGPMTYNPTLKREIPVGWEVKTLDEYLDCNKYSLTAKSSYDFIQYLDTSSLTENTLESLQKYGSQAESPSRAKRIVYANDILYSTVRPQQKHYGIIKNPAQNMIASTGFAILSCKYGSEYNDMFYLFLIQEKNLIKLSAIADSNASSYPSFNPSDLLNLSICLPEDIKTIEPLVKKFSSLFGIIERNQKENQKLTALRDKLLPLLMNGQVVVG